MMNINTEKWRTLDRSIDYGADYSYPDTNLYSLDISYKPIGVRIGARKNCLSENLKMTTIIFSPFIVIDGRCQATVNGKVIWKCNRLLELLEKPDIFLDEREYTPQRHGNDFVILGGWEFNISSTIHANATADDVINGWNMFDKDMGRDAINRLFQPFFYHAASDAKLLPVHKLRNKEPYLIELLRLSYWYYKCSLMQCNNTFPSKRKEIRGKLTRALLTNVEKYKTTVKEDEPIDDIEEFMKKMHEGSINAQKGKPQDNDFKKYIKKDIPAAFWVVNSELIFAGLCNDAGYSVKFDTPIGQHDYDFIINEIPCQVKTILSTEKNIEEYTMKVNNMIAELRAGKKINEEEVKKEILNLLHENQEDIKKAMQQGGRIICINGTHTYAGFLLNQWASDNKVDLEIRSTLQSSINLLHKEKSINLLKDERKFLPLIFGAAAIDINYRFSTMGFKIPISLTLERSKLNQIDIV